MQNLPDPLRFRERYEALDQGRPQHFDPVRPAPVYPAHPGGNVAYAESLLRRLSLPGKVAAVVLAHRRALAELMDTPGGADVWALIPELSAGLDAADAWARDPSPEASDRVQEVLRAAWDAQANSERGDAEWHDAAAFWADHILGLSQLTRKRVVPTPQDAAAATVLLGRLVGLLEEAQHPIPDPGGLEERVAGVVQTLQGDDGRLTPRQERFLVDWWEDVQRRMAFRDVESFSEDTSRNARILARAEAMDLLRRRPRSDEARRFLRWWIVDMGYTQSARSSDVYRSQSGRKVTLKSRNFRAEGGGRGTVSMSLIDAALGVVERAAEALSDTQVLGIIERLQGAETQARQTAASRRAEAARLREWRIYALKRVEYEYPQFRNAMVQALTGQVPVEAAGLALDKARMEASQIARREGEVLAQLEVAPPGRDDSLVNVGDPPWGAFLKFPTPVSESALGAEPVPLVYRWVEEGHPILLRHGGQTGLLTVTIGSTGALTLNGVTGAVELETPFWEEAELGRRAGILSGSIMTTAEGLRAHINLLSEEGHELDGVEQLMRLWCRLLRGYGIQSFRFFSPDLVESHVLRWLAQEGIIEVVHKNDRFVDAICGPGGAQKTLWA